MKNLTWQNPEQLFVAQELINKVKSKCCGIKVLLKRFNILIKSCNTKHGLENKNYIRIAVRNRIDNDRLLDALKSL